MNNCCIWGLRIFVKQTFLNDVSFSGKPRDICRIRANDWHSSECEEETAIQYISSTNRKIQVDEKLPICFATTYLGGRGCFARRRFPQTVEKRFHCPQSCCVRNILPL